MAGAPELDPRIGTELAGCRIERVLGRGAMAVVYLAYHERLDRHVALKLLAPELAEDERFRERFLHESRLAAGLDHPNVIPIHDADEADGVLLIAMGYVEGTDLGRRLTSTGRLEPERALALLEPVAEALDAAHARGLVHRDVKPGNILIAEGAGGAEDHVYLSDFGLSARLGEPSEAGGRGGPLGSLDYLAPEQIDDAELSAQTDVYGLGCVLYHCLVGESPYPGRARLGVLWAHLEDPPPKASERVPGLPEELDAVIARALAKEPEDRHASCHALAAEVRSSLGVELAPGDARSASSRTRR